MDAILIAHTTLSAGGPVGSGPAVIETVSQYAVKTSNKGASRPRHMRMPHLAGISEVPPGSYKPAAAAAAFAAARPGFPRDPASCASGSSSPSEASAFTCRRSRWRFMLWTGSVHGAACILCP